MIDASYSPLSFSLSLPLSPSPTHTLLLDISSSLSSMTFSLHSPPVDLSLLPMTAHCEDE